MGESLYFVKLGSDEERTKLGKLGSREVLVQLICDDHALRHETNRRSSASKLAKHSFRLQYPYLLPTRNGRTHLTEFTGFFERYDTGSGFANRFFKQGSFAATFEDTLQM